jgi:hypothetical protein
MFAMFSIQIHYYSLIFPLRAYASSRPAKEREWVSIVIISSLGRALKTENRKNIKLMHASGYHESNVCVSGGACGPPFSLSKPSFPWRKTPV